MSMCILIWKPQASLTFKTTQLEQSVHIAFIAALSTECLTLKEAVWNIIKYSVMRFSFPIFNE